MKIFITSSVQDTIKKSAELAEELGVGLEISRLPGSSRIDDDFPAIINDIKEQTGWFKGSKTLHGLFSDLNPACKDAAIKKIVEKRFQQSFEAAVAAGAESVVFHSGHKGMKHRISVNNYLEGSVKFWKEYIKQFEDKGMFACIENVLEDSPENLIKIVDEVNSPFLKICLDTGHANLCSQIPPSEWINIYGNRLHHMHLHNNFKTNDDHAGLKYGTVNFLSVVDALKKHNLSPLIVFEIFDKEQLMESIDVFKSITCGR
ncbi:MAG: sugar phosphate isomerase/epimerase family protein [Candidatus Gastranaerophilaceae bacterium]